MLTINLPDFVRNLRPGSIFSIKETLFNSDTTNYYLKLVGDKGADLSNGNIRDYFRGKLPAEKINAWPNIQEFFAHFNPPKD